jgi:hypothetical protein
MKRPIVGVIVKLSQKYGLCPSSLILKDVHVTGEDAVDSGSFGDVWRGCIGEQLVAIKRLRVYKTSDVEKLLKVCAPSLGLANENDLSELGYLAVLP